ncbi:MAG: COX15/CtaA family protein [Betaproteobacteria bacterium]|nr:COX15/CtaA family protein [Betaproteobacteria bacterium]
MDISTRRQIACWLLICCVMVFATLVVGGVTRLTHSGLSIVEWQPLIGALPPLNATEWNEVFLKYQQTPEYLKVNHGMSLDEFKTIFYWEYVHRLLGRGIGLVFLLPFLYFLLRRKIERALALKLIGMFVLGGLQGAMGWYMVKSGLVDDPRVSQYRLTAHLGLAFIIFAVMAWVALGLLVERKKLSSAYPALHTAQAHAGGLALLVFVMVLSGGLVAGLHAGLTYNSFPLMHGYFIPPDMFMLEPWYLNFFNNPGTVQFDHRLIAWILIVLLPLFWFRTRKLPLSSRARLATHVLLGVFAVQIALGISTLLLIVPVSLAAAHQAGAMVLFAALLWLNHELRV